MVRSSIGSTIRGRRNDLRLTQAQAAVAAEISQQHLSIIENGKIEPDIRTLRRIAAALGMEIKVELSTPQLEAGLASVARFNAWERGEPLIAVHDAVNLSDDMARLLPAMPNEDWAQRAAAWKRWRADLARVRA
jgi:transcriptional regulator with XRE-family HTH domain